MGGMIAEGPAIAVIFIKFRNHVDRSKFHRLANARSDCKTRFRFLSFFLGGGPEIREKACFQLFPRDNPDKSIIS